MRIINPSTLVAFAQRHPSAAPMLLPWMGTVRKALWSTFADVRTDLPSADMVKAGSLKPVVISSLAGNHFLIITAIHSDKGRVFLLDFLTHAD